MTEAPPPAPLLFAATGASFAALYMVVGGHATNMLIGAVAGFVVGVTRPLFRYRVVGAVIIAGVAAAVLLMTEAQHHGGTGLSLFTAGAIGFIYGMLFWGDGDEDPFTAEEF